jgi:hypothetical protein
MAGIGSCENPVIKDLLKRLQRCCLVGLSAIVLMVALGPRSGANSVLPPQPAVQEALGAISGVVTDGRSGPPVQAAVVSLVDRSVGVSASAVTDSQGRFVFPNLPPSAGYVMRVHKPGFVASGLSSSTTMVPRTRLRLGAGEWIQHADVALSRLGGISGSVMDEQGEPVVDVPVRALRQIFVTGRPQWASGPVAMTDDRGCYRIADLEPGSYVVQLLNVLSTVPESTPPSTILGLARAPTGGLSQRPRGLNIEGPWLLIGNTAVPPQVEGRQLAYRTVFFPGAPSADGATPIRLGAGDEYAGVDFRLEPVRAVRVSGRLVGPPGSAAGMVARLLPGDGAIQNPGSEQATALADKDGQFVFPLVPVGSYTLDARSAATEWVAAGTIGSNAPPTPGLLGSSGSSFGSSAGEVRLQTRGTTTGTYSNSLSLAVGTESIADVVVELAAGSVLRGRVVDEDSQPWPGAVSVSASPATGDPSLGGRVFDRDVRNRPDRTFSIPGLREGDYLIDVHTQGQVKSIMIEGEDFAHRPISVKAGIDLLDVIVTVSNRSADLTGGVHDSTGQRVAQAAVVVFPSDRTLWKDFGPQPRRIQSTIAVGEGYQIFDLPAGEYFVIAADISFLDGWHDPRFFEVAAPLATRLTLEWGESSTLDLVQRQVVLR